MPYDTEDLGLSERAKELKKWNAPYRYREFPKTLFRGTTTTTGHPEYRMVATEGEEREALALGWSVTPGEAVNTQRLAEEAVGIAAAERAWTERQMSASAQAEAAQVEATTAGHVPEVREQPRRPAAKPRSHKRRPVMATPNPPQTPKDRPAQQPAPKPGERPRPEQPLADPTRPTRPEGDPRREQ